MSFLLKGDFRYFWPETFAGLAHLPSSWDSSLNTGVGVQAVSSLWIVSYLNFTAGVGTSLGLSWEITSLLFWILPAVTLSFLSAYFLFQYLFPSNKGFGFVSAFVYGSNSYIQMVFLGGQIGVSLSYAVLPLVLFGLLRVLEKPGLQRGVAAGFLLSLQILFDPRFALMSFAVGSLYWLLVAAKNIKKQIVYGFIIPFFLTCLLHSFWLLPLLVFHFPSLPAGFSGQEGFRFFSFGDFSHSLALLHPNWPENIFGKVYFLRPQFLLLPILAFSAMLFVSKKESRKVMFFAGLAIVSVFLSKGSKEPLSLFSDLLFLHVPLMNLFRDPTKFYALIALSYAVLLPYALAHLSEVFRKYIRVRAIKQNVGLIVIIVFLLGWLLLHAPLYFESNTRMNASVPNEYKMLKEFLATDDSFFRTLWIPQWQRYGYFSNQQPAIGRNELFTTTDPMQMAKDLGTKQDTLSILQVKYVIIPFDSKEELFLSDRKYSRTLRQKTEQIVDAIPWLTKVDVAPQISVYEVRGERLGRFWVYGLDDIAWQMQSPTHYNMQHTSSDKPMKLFFSEAFDRNWVAKTASGGEIFARKEGEIMSFSLAQNERITEIYFFPQRFVVVGLVIGALTLVAVVVIFVLGRIRMQPVIYRQGRRNSP